MPKNENRKRLREFMSAHDEAVDNADISENNMKNQSTWRESISSNNNKNGSIYMRSRGTGSYRADSSSMSGQNEARNQDNRNQEGGDPYISDKDNKTGSSGKANTSSSLEQENYGGSMENTEGNDTGGRPVRSYQSENMEETAEGQGTSFQQMGTTGPSGNMQTTGAEGSGIPEGGKGMSSNTSSTSEEGGGRISAAQVQQYLQGVSYPAARQDMIDTARTNKAPDDVMSFMNKLPDKTYNSPVDIEKEFGKIA